MRRTLLAFVLGVAGALALVYWAETDNVMSVPQAVRLEVTT